MRKASRDPDETAAVDEVERMLGELSDEEGE